MALKLLFIFIVGLFLFGTGTYVWKKQQVSFIAGYGEFYHPRNEQLLAKRIGTVIRALGVETWILLPLALYIPEFKVSVYGVVAFLHVLMILLLIAADHISSY